MRLYKGADWIDVKLVNPPMYSEIKTIRKEHIPYSNKSSIIDLGWEREVTLEIDALTDEERNQILAFLDGITAISDDGGATYYEAKYLGGEEVNFFGATWHIIKADFSLSACKYSSVETVKTADQVLPNSGNHFATPTFEISGEGSDGITISDGVRTLIITKEITNTDVLKISDWQLIMNSADISEYLSGDYPRIPESQTSFVFAVTGITPSSITVKYRETWR